MTKNVEIITGNAQTLSALDTHCQKEASQDVGHFSLFFCLVLLWSPYVIGQTHYIFMLWLLLSSFYGHPMK